MLVLDPRNTGLVLMQDTPEDRELLAMVADLFDRDPDTIRLFGISRGHMEVGGRRWPVEPFHVLLGAEEREKLEYDAYALVDRLVEHMADGVEMDALLAAYHEVATNWFRVLLAARSADQPGFPIAVLERDYYDAFENARKRLGPAYIQFVDGYWKERQKSFWRRGPFFLRSVANWLSPRLERHGGRFMSLIEPYRYRLVSRLVHWGGMARIIASRVRRHGPRYLKMAVRDPARLIASLGGGGGLLRKRLRMLFSSGKPAAPRATALQEEDSSRWGSRGRRAAQAVANWWHPVGFLQRVGNRLFRRGAGEQTVVRELDPALERVLAGIGAENIVLMTLSDSGTRVNLDPALVIREELEGLGVPVLILTDSPFVVEACRARSIADMLFVIDAAEELARGRAPVLPRDKHADVLATAVQRGLDALLQIYWPYHMRRARHVEKLLARIEEVKNVRTIFSINDYLPVAVLVGRWGQRRNLPWIGHFPILVGARPDGYFFPAPEHLAYGTQLRDHLVSAGTDPEKITVVGAHTYDQHYGRDRAADRRAVERDFPEVRGKKLVTIGTEAFPDPETELGPVLDAVAPMKGVRAILKVHPSDDEAFFRTFVEMHGGSKRVEVVKTYPLGQLLGASDLLIVVISNIAIEAAVIGTPTLMCDFSGKADVINFVREGLCTGCNDPRDVERLVHGLLFDEACAKDAREKMKRGLERFNGPNDGKSCDRIARYVARRAGMGGAEENGAGR